jgi:hypothetical protein
MKRLLVLFIVLTLVLLATGVAGAQGGAGFLSEIVSRLLE